MFRQFLRRADDFLLTAVIQRDIQLQPRVPVRAADGGVQRVLLLFQPLGHAVNVAQNANTHVFLVQFRRSHW